MQALLHRYETFHRADGHVVKLPMDRGEGQQWSRAPGNLLSTPREVAIDPARDEVVRIELDKAIPPIPPPEDTKYVQARADPERAAHEVLGPADAPRRGRAPARRASTSTREARYPLVVFHGHFPYTLRRLPRGAARPEPEACEYSERFRLDCYNRIQQEQAHQLYQDWTAPGFPRFLVIEIQHANPYYDDSYAVNSENLGPYGDAIPYELIPYVEKTFRGLGQGWARFTLRRLDGRLGGARACRSSTPTSTTAAGPPAPTRSTSAPT